MASIASQACRNRRSGPGRSPCSPWGRRGRSKTPRRAFATAGGLADLRQGRPEARALKPRAFGEQVACRSRGARQAEWVKAFGPPTLGRRSPTPAAPTPLIALSENRSPPSGSRARESPAGRFAPREPSHAHHRPQRGRRSAVRDSAQLGEWPLDRPGRVEGCGPARFADQNGVRAVGELPGRHVVARGVIRVAIPRVDVRAEEVGVAHGVDALRSKPAVVPRPLAPTAREQVVLAIRGFQDLSVPYP